MSMGRRHLLYLSQQRVWTRPDCNGLKSWMGGSADENNGTNILFKSLIQVWVSGRVGALRWEGLKYI